MSGVVKVFLSYAKEDQADATRLFEELKNRDIEVWFDKELLLPDKRLIFSEYINYARIMSVIFLN